MQLILHYCYHYTINPSTHNRQNRAAHEESAAREPIGVAKKRPQ